VLSSLHWLLQLSLATFFAAWCSAAHAVPHASARMVVAAHHGPVLTQCIERVVAHANVECELDEAPPAQQRFHAPDLLGLDDQPDDEDLGSTTGEVKVYGPRAVALGPSDDRRSPKRDPHTQLERPPRA